MTLSDIHLCIIPSHLVLENLVNIITPVIILLNLAKRKVQGVPDFIRYTFKKERDIYLADCRGKVQYMKRLIIYLVKMSSCLWWESKSNTSYLIVEF